MMIAPFKYPGAKWSYAQWIVSHFPEHSFYVEPYFGSGAAFFNKEKSKYETINDIDNLVVNLFRVCRDYPDELARVINLTPFSRTEFLGTREVRGGEDIPLSGDIVEDARRFVVRCHQGFGSLLADRVGWKNTKQSTGPVNPKIWSKVPANIYAVAERLKDAQIECTDAVQLIRDCNHTNCLVYADPPYLGDVRNGKMYRWEMLDHESHTRLLLALLDHNGPVIISGYDHPLYNEILTGWHKETMQGHANNASKRTETLWMNYEVQTKLY